GLTSRGIKRLLFFSAAALLAFAVVISFSRGGFLGLVAIGGVLLWKAGRGRRFVTLSAALVISGAFLVAMPSGYGERVFDPAHRTGPDQLRPGASGAARARSRRHRPPPDRRRRRRQLWHLLDPPPGRPQFLYRDRRRTRPRRICSLPGLDLRAAPVAQTN